VREVIRKKGGFFEKAEVTSQMEAEKSINSDKCNVKTTIRKAKKWFKEQLAEGIKTNSKLFFK